MSSVIIQEIHIMKRVFGESVIDSIIKSVEDAIKTAPGVLTPDYEMSPALYMFADLIYDDKGVKRLISFKQYGPLYVAHVYNKEGMISISDKTSVFCAYSIYDILEVFNLTTKNKKLRAPYITLFESTISTTYGVLVSSTPKNYDNSDCKFDYEKALNEIGKYKFYFWNGTSMDTPIGVVDVICNPHLISAGNIFTQFHANSIDNNICGSVVFSKQGFVIISDNDYSVVDLDRKDIEESYSFVAKNDNVTASDILFSNHVIDVDSNGIREWDYEGKSRKIKLLGWQNVTVSSDILINLIENAKPLNEIVLSGGYLTLNPVFELLPEGTSTLEELLDWENKFIIDFHPGTGNYGYSADEDPIDQNSNQAKISIDKYIELADHKRVVQLNGNLDDMLSWTSTNPNQQDSVHKWFALDIVLDHESLTNGLNWCDSLELTDETLDSSEGPDTLTLWLKLDEINETPKIIKIVNKNDLEDIEEVEIRFVNRKE